MAPGCRPHQIGAGQQGLLAALHILLKLLLQQLILRARGAGDEGQRAQHQRRDHQPDKGDEQLGLQGMQPPVRRQRFQAGESR